MKKIIFTILLGVMILIPLSVSATGIGDALNNLGAVNQNTGLEKDLPTSLGTVISTALSLVGTIFLALMIYAGILWMTAQGNDEKVTKAKDIIIAAIIGLAVTMSAYAITFFVTSKLTGASGVGGGGGGTNGGDGGAGGGATEFTEADCSALGGVCMGKYTGTGTYDLNDPCDPDGSDNLVNTPPMGICPDKTECCEMEDSAEKCTAKGGIPTVDSESGCGNATMTELFSYGDTDICCKKR